MLLLISCWNLWVVGVGSTDQTRNLYNEDGEAPQHCAAVRGEQPAASLSVSLSVSLWGFSYIHAKLQLVCFFFFFEWCSKV
jgi:hypothetical protein